MTTLRDLPQLSSDALSELTQRRWECLQRLCALSRRQAELADAGQIDELLAVLDDKQPLLAALQRISLALAPLAGQEPELRAWASRERHLACRQRWEECERLVAEIVQLEQRSAEAVRTQRDRLGQQIALAHDARSVHVAYLSGWQRSAAQVGGQLDVQET